MITTLTNGVSINPLALYRKALDYSNMNAITVNPGFESIINPKNK